MNKDTLDRAKALQDSDQVLSEAGGRFVTMVMLSAEPSQVKAVNALIEKLDPADRDIMLGLALMMLGRSLVHNEDPWAKARS